MGRSADGSEGATTYRRCMATELLQEADLELERAQAALLERCAPDASVRRIRWRGGETQVVELGEGPTLVLVHGGGDAGFNWYPVLGALADGRRVVVVDRPGHGLAEPFDYRGVDLLAHGTAFVADLLDALGVEKAELAGCSIGGLWTAAFALEAPDRVERLSLVGSPPG